MSLLLSKGAAESALADEMGRLKVQEEVRNMWHHPHTIYTYITYVRIYDCKTSVAVLFTLEAACSNSMFAPDCSCRRDIFRTHGVLVRSCINLPA